MNRRLAVPLAISLSNNSRTGSAVLLRRVRESDMDPLDQRITRQIAENRKHIEEIRGNLQDWGPMVDCSDIVNELDFVRANIQLSLLGVAGELDGVPSSEELFEEALA